MKKLTGKMRIFKYLLAALLVVVLFTPEVAQAAELSVKSGSRKDYTATANGETIHVTLSGVTTNTQLMGKPSRRADTAHTKITVRENCVITPEFRKTDSYIPDEDIYIPNNLLDK